MVLQGNRLNPKSFEMLPRKIGIVDDRWGMRFDPLTISRSIRGSGLICNVVVVLSSINQCRQANL